MNNYWSYSRCALLLCALSFIGMSCRDAAGAGQATLGALTGVTTPHVTALFSNNSLSPKDYLEYYGFAATGPPDTPTKIVTVYDDAVNGINFNIISQVVGGFNGAAQDYTITYDMVSVNNPTDSEIGHTFLTGANLFCSCTASGEADAHVDAVFYGSTPSGFGPLTSGSVSSDNTNAKLPFSSGVTTLVVQTFTHESASSAPGAANGIANIADVREYFDTATVQVLPQILSFNFEGVVTLGIIGENVGDTIRGTVTYNANPLATNLSTQNGERDYEFSNPQYGIQMTVPGQTITANGDTSVRVNGANVTYFATGSNSQIEILAQDVGSGGVIPGVAPTLADLQSGFLSYAFIATDQSLHQANVAITSVGPALNHAAKLVTGSPVELSQLVDTPASAFRLSFDYQYLTGPGVLNVSLGGTTLATINAPDSGSNASFAHEVLAIPDDLLGKSGLKLDFLLDGPAGAILLLDNVSMPGITNGGFETLDLTGWTVVKSEQGMADVIAAGPEPSAAVLFLIGCVGLLIRFPRTYAEKSL
jgi:hypothetical protein